MPDVGGLIRGWRRKRRMTQQDLAEAAEVSTRHLSCLETGKARPSQEMVLVLGSAMDMPLRARNTLLMAAGFAPAYRQHDLDAPEMASVRLALDFLLKQAEPYGAVVLDRTWHVIQVNRAFELLGVMLGSPVLPGDNLLRLLFTGKGLREVITNWEELARDTLQRLHREAIITQDEALFALFEELLAVPGVPASWRRDDPEEASALVVPMNLRVMGQELSMFTTVTTLGTPVDVTLSELRIESYFPATPETEAFVRQVVVPALDV
ncbi:MAG: XRE family transcriptional regulator [Deltaproteobacteria bacterium]|nr:MAG: XRE family transcriptional regulator [Deltaproteobacteria bacterium]